MSKLVFKRPIRLGNAGLDVLAVKRALVRALAAQGKGPKKLRGLTPVLGPYFVKHLKTYQRTIPVMPTGEYGLGTHEHLIQHFDRYSRWLYERSSKRKSMPIGGGKPPAGALKLERSFHPTHQTAGLPGYPAVDVFARPGTTVLAPESGIIDRLSGKDPALGGRPGGAYGWSIYLDGDSGDHHFMTHFGSRRVRVGDRVREGDVLGTVADSAISGKPGTSHIHHGVRRKA